MDSPNKNRLRIGAVIGATVIAGLIGTTTANAGSGSGTPVVEGATSQVSVVVPHDVWVSKCNFLVAQAAEWAAKQEAAALAAAELKAAEVAAAQDKADKIAKDKAAAKEAKAAKASKAKSHHKHHKHHGWSQSADANKSKDGHKCDGNKQDDSGNSDSTDA